MIYDDDWMYEDLNRRAEGYECGKCGYVPTRRELNNGTCPGCRDIKRALTNNTMNNERSK